MTGPGRPTLYKPEHAELARRLCMLGATNRGLADSFGVARSTIDLWIATIPDFAYAVRQGREGYSRKARNMVHHRREAAMAPYKLKLDVPPDLRASILLAAQSQARAR